MTLREWQKGAIDAAALAIKDKRRGVIRAIMGAGKSVVIAQLAELAHVTGLHVVVTVPNQELVRQLASSIERFTELVVGRWYADERDLWPVTVVCHASLATYEAAFAEKYGALVVDWVEHPNGYRERMPTAPRRLWIADEAHRTECETVLAWSAPERRVALTATPWRAEHGESISSFDEVIFEYGAEQAHADGHVVKPTLHHPTSGDVDDVVAAWSRDALAKYGGGAINASSIDDADAFAARIGATAVHSASSATPDDARKIIATGGAVVYVDMLAEGFDCPEIRWMALRRPVKSRVRFAQEVGRGLRADRGKTTCHMLDVHDLWGVHSMDWRAALGDVDEDTIPALKLDWLLEETGFDGRGSRPGEPERLPPELLSPLRSWLRHERVAAIFDGRISGREIASRSWRSDPCSRRQLAYLDEIMASIDPSRLDAGMVARVRAARAALVDCLTRDPDDLAGAFRKGDASDLIDVVRSLK